MTPAVDEARAVAFHEAGHAVAVVLRGGGTFKSILLDESGHGLTLYSAKPCDSAFIAFAGPWAEARQAWGERPLEVEDDDGCTFSDYVVGVLLQQPDDASRLGDVTSASQDVWMRELECVWGAVQSLAGRLLAGESVTHEDVEAAADAYL